MKLAIDYHLVDRNPNSGMGVYVSEITKLLSDLNGVGNTLIFHMKIGGNKSLIYKILGIFDEQIWIQYHLKREFRDKKIDLVYFPNPPVTFFSNIPIILTIPDLSFLHDNKMSFIIKIYLYINYFFSAKKAKLITTFSTSSKNDIAKYLLVSKNKIKVNPLGVKNIFKKRDGLNPADLLNKFKIYKKYILSVPGSFVPRKNMEDLINAYTLLKKPLKEKIIMVMVGNNNDNYFNNFYNLVKNKGLVKNIVFTGYVNDDELKVLYSNALMFVFPSLYEGFGLPPLESMASGAPVIVYNRSSLPEVVGDAAIVVNNYKELSNSITDLFLKKTLRNKLINKGFERVRIYNWSDSGRRMFNILSKLNT